MNEPSPILPGSAWLIVNESHHVVRELRMRASFWSWWNGRFPHKQAFNQRLPPSISLSLVYGHQCTCICFTTKLQDGSSGHCGQIST